MTDIIRGPVIHIVDGDTFDMEVTHLGQNECKYKDRERIRIDKIDVPELQNPKGKRSKEQLEKKLKGKVVKCHVQRHEIVAKVELYT